MEKLDKIQFCNSVATVLIDYFNFNVDVAFFIGCQFGLESNFGQSRLAQKYNNFCGMKRPLVRISTALIDEVSKKLEFASYVSFVDCIFDFALCLQYRKPLSSNLDSVPHYIAFIKNWYCPEKDYIDKIKSIYSQLNSLKNGK